MTVSSTTTYNVLSTNGVTIEFPFSFYLTEKTQVFCELIYSDESRAQYENFTVTISVDGVGGSITTGDILNDVDIVIYRGTPLTQETDYIPGGRFPAESHEDALDKLTLQNQEQQEEIDRCLKHPIDADYYDFEGKRLINVGAGINGTDGVNLEQVKAIAAGGVSDHNLLLKRDEEGAHPASAVTDTLYGDVDKSLKRIRTLAYAGVLA